MSEYLCKCGRPGRTIPVPLEARKMYKSVVICPECMKEAVDKVAKGVGGSDA